MAKYLRSINNKHPNDIVMSPKYSDYNLKNNRGEESQTTVEWYTPPEIIEQARKLLGGYIRFDPSSCERANQLVKAERYYSFTERDENGLELPWYDGMWMNPPYDRNTNQRKENWFTRANNFYEEGLFDTYGGLVLGRGDSHGITLLKQKFPFILCKRIRFYRWDSNLNIFVAGSNPLPGSCIFYLGNSKKHNRFKELFCQFGTPLRAW